VKRELKTGTLAQTVRELDAIVEMFSVRGTPT
jgi:hypothetical protein